MGKCIFCGNKDSFFVKEKVICNILCDGSGNFIDYADGGSAPMIEDVLEIMPPYFCNGCGASYSELDVMDSSTLEAAPNLFVPIIDKTWGKINEPLYHVVPFRLINDMVQWDRRICSFVFCDQHGNPVEMPQFSIPAVRHIIEKNNRIIPDIYCKYSPQEQVTTNKKEC